MEGREARSEPLAFTSECRWSIFVCWGHPPLLGEEEVVHGHKQSVTAMLAYALKSHIICDMS